MVLCGHATLAAAHFLSSGILTAKRVPEAKASNSQFDSPTGYSIPVVQVTETNFTHVTAISKSLNGASMAEMYETSLDDHFVRI